MMRPSYIHILLLSFLSLFAAQSASTAESTGFIRVEQIDGTWWFINAEGERFVSLGVNHIEPHLWLAPYNKEITLKRYGADMISENGRFNTHGDAAKKWIDRQIEITQSLHFNTFGPHTHGSINPALYIDQVYYVARLDTGPLAGWRQRNGEGPRPDVFSHDFRHFIKSRVKDVCARHKASKNLLGYMYTDVPSWIMSKADQKATGNDILIYPWVNAIVSLGEGSAGKQRWLKLLQERYPSAEAAAETWGIRISPTYGISWETMARRIDWSQPTDREKADADMVAFLYLIADKWYRIHREVVLAEDPNHLLLGDKNMSMWHYDWVLAAAKKHIDVVAVQSYGFWSEEKERYDKIYKATGKPIFNGDGCYSYAQPQQIKWGVKGFRTGAKSVAEVAKFYRETLEGMMATPYIVGWHHCGYLQQWDEAERGDSPRNENGFLDPFEKELTTWTDVIREINGQATKLHKDSGTKE